MRLFGTGTPGNQNDNNLVATLCYVVCKFLCCQVLDYLMKIGFKKDHIFGTMHKLRAIRCLLAVADEDMIKEHTAKSVEEGTASTIKGSPIV